MHAHRKDTAVLQRLSGEGNSSAKWPLSRAAWRAGELRLTEAEPFLIGLIHSADSMLDYCIAWALGQCGTAASVEALRKLEAKHQADSVRRIAGVALFQLLNDDDRETAIAESVSQLPEGLRQLAVEGPADSFTDELNRTIAQDGVGTNGCLEIIYLIDNEYVRPALLDFLQNAPLEPGQFRRVRHIFKAAELKRDHEVFGILARRFEVTPARFKTPRFKMQGYYPQQQLPTTRPYPTQAFSQQTRTYLRRRTWRTLKRFADLGESNDYARMAAGVLKAFSDPDALPVRQEQFYEWNPQTRRGHEKSDIRDAIRGTVIRLCESDSLFGERLAALLIEALLIPGAPDGVPTHTARVLREDRGNSLRNVSSETVWLLLQSRSSPAQEVGGALLATNVNAADLTVDEIVKLGSHEILSVRESSWQMCTSNVLKLQSDPESAARMAAVGKTLDDFHSSSFETTFHMTEHFRREFWSAFATASSRMCNSLGGS